MTTESWLDKNMNWTLITTAAATATTGTRVAMVSW